MSSTSAAAPADHAAASQETARRTTREDEMDAEFDAALTAPPGAGLHPGWPPLSTLIASRICHDLISPVGAVCNGVELIEQFGASGAQEMSLIGGSARTASALLELFRCAFGAGAADGVYGLDRLRKVLAGRFFEDRVELVWDSLPGGETTRLGARLTALGAMGLGAALPRGGTLRVSTDGPHGILLRAEGPVLRIDPSTPDWVAGGPGERAPESRDIQWAAAAAFAAAGDARLGFSTDEGFAALSIALPGT